MQTVQLALGTSQATLDARSNRIFIGRDAQVCGLALLDASLSRRHAEVFVEGGQTYLRDLGSSNGTWLNGQPVTGDATVIGPGQQIYLGTVPLLATWHGGAIDGGATVAMAMPPELRAMLEQRKAAMAQMLAQPAPAAAAPWPPATANAPAPGIFPGGAGMLAHAPATAGLGVGGHSAPLPAEYAYRRQGSNGNGVLLIALRGDTFANNMMLEGFLEYTALDNEHVASITIELVEVHRGSSHVWDRMLVRQGPWRSQKGDVLPLPFHLRVPPGTSISGRHVYWELRACVDINWASDVEATAPINMRNTDLERIRDALGALDYRIADLEAEALGQRFVGTFQPPANLARQMGINEIAMVVEYLGANLKVVMELDKKGVFKKDREHATVFDLSRFRAASVAEITANFRQQIESMMAMR